MYRRIGSCLIASTLALAVLSAASADDAGKAAKREETALAAVADELHRLARVCILYRAYSEARAELELGLAVSPSSQKLKDELSKLPSQETKPAPGFQAKYEEEKKKSREKCADLLADLAVSSDKEGASEPFERALGLLQDHFPEAKALGKVEFAWFPPYFKNVRKADLARLEAGSEFVDGKWIDSATVAALDKEHATWTSPWVVSDAVHEVRTTAGLRTAKRILAHIGSFRGFLLKRFAGSWDLRPPARGKLPVIVTETQVDHKARMMAEVGGALSGGHSGAARYVFQPHRPLNPCFVTFEPTFAGGRVLRVSLDDILPIIQHEVTHQIAFEYSKFDSDHRRDPTFDYWCVEGIASYMQSHVVEEGKWRIAHPRSTPMGGATTPGDFAWCAEWPERVITLEKLFLVPHEKFVATDLYHAAATVAHFMLDGENGKYRASFMRLIEIVHKAKEDAKTFDSCFAGKDRKAMQEEFTKFVREMKID